MLNIHPQDGSNEEQLSDDGIELGWCRFCKEIVTTKDEYIKQHDGVDHVSCYKEENGIIEELNFDK